MAAQVRDLKWVRGTKFIVDGFNFQDPECRTYFLTHCHSVRSCAHILPSHLGHGKHVPQKQPLRGSHKTRMAY